MESEAGLCPALRHRPEQPSPQWVGAVAASERDDRAAVTVRVPHRLPDRRGNRTGCGVQTAMADFTHRAPAARCYRCAATVVHTLPQFFADACTRYRRSAHHDARAGVRAMARLRTRFRARMERLCFRYRSASARSASPAAASPPARSTAAERTITGVVMTTPASRRTGARRSPRRRRRGGHRRGRAPGRRHRHERGRRNRRTRILVGTNGRRRAQRAAGQASARSARRARRREG